MKCSKFCPYSIQCYKNYYVCMFVILNEITGWRKLFLVKNGVLRNYFNWSGMCESVDVIEQNSSHIASCGEDFSSLYVKMKKTKLKILPVKHTIFRRKLSWRKIKNTKVRFHTVIFNGTRFNLNPQNVFQISNFDVTDDFMIFFVYIVDMCYEIRRDPMVTCLYFQLILYSCICVHFLFNLFFS